MPWLRSSRATSKSVRGECYNFLTSFPLLFLNPPINLPYLHRWNPFFYIYLFHQNYLIYIPFFHFLHSLMPFLHFLHSLVHFIQNFLSNEHSLKAMHSFTIKILPSSTCPLV